jgi:predicted XRE-type DNA-binding protein
LRYWYKRVPKEKIHVEIFGWITYTAFKEAHVALTVGISQPLTETFISGHISALSETFISECFATQRANLTAGQSDLSRLLLSGKIVL